MKKDIKVEILREKNIEKIKNMIDDMGKYEVLSSFSNFFDKRTYFKVNAMGDVAQKNYNPIFILFTLCEDTEKLAEYILKYSYPEEKQNLRKIERSSNLTVEKLKENLMKTLISCNLDFSKTFAKELYLRSEKDFFEVLYTFSLMGVPQNLKLFYVYFLEKIFKEYKYEDNILYLVISYLTKVRDEYSTYIASDETETEILLASLNEDKKMYIEIFNEVIEKYDFKNKNKFKNTLNKYFEQDFSINVDIKENFKNKNI